ncbi:MAG: hypothetical protein LUQ47_01835 [Methanotrichaceae archaeon]|nr:hypothetical protein [Methanotrichaceae archaeon]
MGADDSSDGLITPAHYQKKYSRPSGVGFEGLTLDIREYTQKAIEAYWLAGPLIARF